jgi:prevent-host-death family protein
MFNIEVAENAKDLKEALDRLARGEDVTISRKGKPVARLVPVQGTSDDQVQQAVDHLQDFHKTRSLDGLSLRELREEGRP